VQKLWTPSRTLIFGLATGAVVRLIAPLLTDKSRDPAVIVIDPLGQFVISLCGGHQGGGDRLTRLIAQLIGGTAIVTGASQAVGLPPLDVFGETYGWRKGPGDWTKVSAIAANGQQLQVRQTAGSQLWSKALAPEACWSLSTEGETPQAYLNIGVQPPGTVEPEIPQVQWYPRVLWVGIGCVRGTPQALIAQALTQVFQTFNLAEAAIAGLASIDIKADEEGLVALAQERAFPLQCYGAERLREVEVPQASPRVEQEVGTPSVAEAAALLAARAYGEAQLIVPKQILKPEGYGITVAIAQAEREYLGQTGQLWLVGLGPGALEQMTPAARVAIVQADVIVGYSLYLDLIQSLKRPEQIIEAFPITQERERCQRAIALAQWGLKVAVISSGDCGIYAMAGLVLEELQKLGWDGQTPRVEVLPGITALQAAAAKVGAPLMHDFCAISLSDLLTPRQTILQRLTAAAQADFVTALYNPQSQKRTELIQEAQRIFLAHRDPQTPVAIARAVYRQEESIIKTTLAEMLTFPIDMLTVVIIGNTTTYLYQDWLITPRGY
jgi:cobalt-precorrin 5A hydrolase/precorrin-3B C17-methyltransferase